MRLFLLTMHPLQVMSLSPMTMAALRRSATASQVTIYSDAENDAEGLSIYRWLRNSATIGGATTSTYTLAALDAGQSITFEVTPVAATGNTPGSTETSDAIAVNSAPTASAVSITGSTVIGATLTGSYTYADVDGDAQGTSTFKWLRDGSPIPGATSLTYVLTVADLGQSITFEVTPIAATGANPGSPVISSNSSTVANSAPVAKAGPDQTPLVGEAVILDGSGSTDYVLIRHSTYKNSWITICYSISLKCRYC
jgi:hypothetical protein